MTKFYDQLYPIHLGPEKEVNIFFPGYREAQNEEDLVEIINYILRAKPRGKVYLHLWSNTFLPSSIDKYVAKAIEELIRGKCYGLAACVTAFRLAAEIIQFMGAQNRAYAVANNLIRKISKIPNIKHYNINLIGYSLGAHVVHTALQIKSWEKYKLKDVILLAGATGADFEEWYNCFDKVGGTIYNAYSPNDGVLKWIKKIGCLQTSNDIGLGGILATSPNLVNRKYPSFGHRDYWQNLEYILSRLWREYEPSQELGSSIYLRSLKKVLTEANT